MRAWFPIALGIVLVGAGSARAQDVTARVRAGAGYDTNPVFAATRDASVPGVADPAAPSAYTGASGSVELGSGTRTRLTLGLDADARLYFSGHALSFERLAAALSTELTPSLVFVARVEATRFDTSYSSDEATTGRLRAGVRWTIRDDITLGLAAGAGLRAYDTGDQLDALGSGGLDVRVLLGRRARISAGIDLERRASDVLRATRWELAPWLTISIDPARGVQLAASYALYLRGFDVERRSGLEHVVRIEATWMPFRALGFFASLEGGLARGNTEALRYERLDTLLGARVLLSTSTPERGDGDAEPARARAPDGPVSEGARPDTVHFRIEAPGAARVAIVGSFNAWSEPAGMLVESADGVFEADLVVPPGRHSYHLLVDGEPARPAGASRYIDDGFGSEDAVFDVPTP